MSTFLEFNRDLFLCNSINRLNDQNDLVPTQYNNNIFIRGNDKHRPFIDNNVNIYYLDKGFIDQTIMSQGSTMDGNTRDHINNGTLITTDQNIGNIWIERKINYATYIQDLEKYSNYDIYVGKGQIIRNEIVSSDVTTQNTGNNYRPLSKVKEIPKNNGGKGSVWNRIRKRIFPKPKQSKKKESFTGNQIQYTVNGGDLDKLDSGSIGTCDTYPLNSVCPTDDPKKKEACEICKNFKYRDWYDANNPNEISNSAKYEDATSEYVHTWLQTWNLGIGIMVLTYGIYYQLS